MAIDPEVIVHLPKNDESTLLPAFPVLAVKIEGWARRMPWWFWLALGLGAPSLWAMWKARYSRRE